MPLVAIKGTSPNLNHEWHSLFGVISDGITHPFYHKIFPRNRINLASPDSICWPKYSAPANCIQTAVHYSEVIAIVELQSTYDHKTGKGEKRLDKSNHSIPQDNELLTVRKSSNTLLEEYILCIEVTANCRTHSGYQCTDALRKRIPVIN